MMDQLAQAIVDFDDKKAKRAAAKMLKESGGFVRVVESVKEGMNELGKRYERKEYFLSDLIMGVALAEDIFEMAKPYLEGASGQVKGKVVIGTVEGSVHSMGKSIVISMLTSSGYEVHDLGANVPAERFVEKVRELCPDVLALSVGLTQALPSVKEVVECLRKAGLREKVKIILGGNAANAQRAEEAGVDAYAPSAVAGLKMIEAWTSGSGRP